MLLRLDRHTGLALTLSVWALLTGVPAGAQASNPAHTQSNVNAEPTVETPEPQALPDLSKISDARLTRMAAHWDRLPTEQRRALLREMKLRMARQQGRGGAPKIHAERRFGKLVRRPDGSVVRVETRVIRIRPPQQQAPAAPAQAEAQADAPATRVHSEPVATQRESAPQPRFGVGFERRIILRPRTGSGRPPARANGKRPITTVADPAQERPAQAAP